MPAWRDHSCLPVRSAPCTVVFEVLAARHQLVDGDKLEQVPLSRHQAVDALNGLLHIRTQPRHWLVVADVAVRCRLAGTDVLVVLRLRYGHGFVQAAKIPVEFRKPFVILGFERENYQALDPLQPLEQRVLVGAFVLCQGLFDTIHPRQDRVLLGCRQEFGTRYRQQVIAPLDQHLVLLDAQPHTGVQLAELIVYVGSSGS